MHPGRRKLERQLRYHHITNYYGNQQRYAAGMGVWESMVWGC